MSDIKAGVICVTDETLVERLRMPIGGARALGEKEVVTGLQVDRRRNPAWLVLNTGSGMAARGITFAELGRRLVLPPMHQIEDMWIDTKRRLVCCVVTGGQMPVVPHGRPIPDVELVVELVEERPGVPEHLHSRIEKKRAA